MTSVMTKRPGRGAKRDRAAGPLPTRSRSKGSLLVAAILIVLGALLGLLYSMSGDSVSVLTVNSEVAAGEVIERADLESTNVAGVEQAIAVDRVDEVVGSTAVVGLVPGQVITDGVFTSDPIPANGQTVVGVALTPSQVPAIPGAVVQGDPTALGDVSGGGVEGLAPGDLVRAISVPAADEASAESAASVLAPRAQVVAVGRSDVGEASTVVTLIVPDGQADAIATASAAGRVALVKIPAGQSEGEGQPQESEGGTDPAEGQDQ